VSSDSFCPSWARGGLKVRANNTMLLLGGSHDGDDRRGLDSCQNHSLHKIISSRFTRSSRLLLIFILSAFSSIYFTHHSSISSRGIITSSALKRNLSLIFIILARICLAPVPTILFIFPTKPSVIPTRHFSFLRGLISFLRAFLPFLQTVPPFLSPLLPFLRPFFSLLPSVLPLLRKNLQKKY
jgi:hypothetical protein